MRQIHDEKLLHQYMERFHIDAFFDTPDLPFRLYEYAPGEFLNLQHKPGDYLKFVVEGSIRIYDLRPDGSTRFVVESSQFEVLGDMEFCGYVEENHYQQVVKQTRTVELPLQNIRQDLWNDNRFLRHLLQRIGHKLSMTSQSRLSGSRLVDILVDYMRYECPDHRITSVDDTAFRLNYSRAQLQRVLRDLTQQGILQKHGKGTYQLAK